jgi:flagellar FliL protein
MADEEQQAEGPRRRPWLKVLLLVIAALIFLLGAVLLALFLTGYFDKLDQQTVEIQLEKARRDAAEGAASAPGKPASAAEPAGQAKQVQPKFEYRYLEFERPLVANVASSRRVMQVQLAFMTRYDDRVTQNLKKHEFALRSAALDVMRQTTEAELENPDFRKILAERLRTEINAVLERLEQFGGVEEAYFTSFVVQ